MSVCIRLDSRKVQRLALSLDSRIDYDFIRGKRDCRSLRCITMLTIFDVCDFAVEAVGCFKDKSARALPKLIKNMRGQIDWYHMGNTVADCAKLVQENGYKVSITDSYLRH